MSVLMKWQLPAMLMTQNYTSTRSTQSLVCMSANTVPGADLLCMCLCSLDIVDFRLLFFLSKISCTVQHHPTLICTTVLGYAT
jgi:hypothetical protein